MHHDHDLIDSSAASGRFVSPASRTRRAFRPEALSRVVLALLALGGQAAADLPAPAATAAPVETVETVRLATCGRQVSFGAYRFSVRQTGLDEEVLRLRVVGPSLVAEHTFETSYGHFVLEAVDLDRDGTPELLLTRGEGRGTCARIEFLHVFRLEAGQLQEIKFVSLTDNQDPEKITHWTPRIVAGAGGAEIEFASDVVVIGDFQ